MPPELVVSASAAQRLACARAWLSARAPGEELLVVAASGDAALELTRACCAESAAGASFGWQRATLPAVAAQLADAWLRRADRIPVARAPAVATLARAVHRLAERGELGRYAPVASSPGFCAAA